MRQNFSKRVAGGVIAAEKMSAEWTCEGRTKGICLVVTDGDHTRYPDGVHCVHENERALCVNLGGTAGFDLVPNFGAGFFYFVKEKSL